MLVYRIVKSRQRTLALSGTGAFKYGGRWNGEGYYALYSSEHPSLALLEVLVHVDESELPSDLFIVSIEIKDAAPVKVVNVKDLPSDWRIPGNIELQSMGNHFLQDNKHLAMKVPSAVLPGAFNYIINPQFPGFKKLARVVHVEPLQTDRRLR